MATQAAAQNARRVSASYICATTYWPLNKTNKTGQDADEHLTVNLQK